MRCTSVVLSLSLVGFLAAGACGGDDSNGHLADAPPPSDGPVPDLPVTLTVTKDGAAMAGVRVYFVNADDTVVASASTDATGTASASLAAGGSVTAINPFRGPVPIGIAFGAASDELRTFAGVKPGDHLVLTQTAPQTVTFTLIAGLDGNANAYDVFTTCGIGSLVPGGGGSGSGSPDPSAVLSLDDCHGAADLAIVSREVNSDINRPVSGLYHAGATLPAGGTVDLRGDRYGALTDINFTYLNRPDAAISVRHFPVLAHGRLGPFQLDASAGTAISHEPAVAATAAVVETSLSVSGNSRHGVVDWGSFATSYMLDLDHLLLRDLVSRPSFNPTTRRMSWVEAPLGAVADLTITAIDVTRFNPAPRSWRWQLAAPYTPGEVRFPKLPTDVFDYTATSEDSVFAEQVMNAKVPGGYDAVRAHVLDVADRLRNGADLSALVAGATGRALVVQTQSIKLQAR
jgi:hypothetical protein